MVFVCVARSEDFSRSFLCFILRTYLDVFVSCTLYHIGVVTIVTTEGRKEFASHWLDQHVVWSLRWFLMGRLKLKKQQRTKQTARYG